MTISISATAISGYIPYTVGFSYIAENTPESIEWNFGDGETSTAEAPNHTYNNEGTYTVTLTASAGGNTETASIEITVSTPHPADVSASASETTAYAPARIVFSSTVTGGEPQDYEYEWNFGDGETSIQPNPEHIFAEAGTYTVTLTVRNNAGQTEAPPAQLTITIEAATYPQINITAQQVSGLSVKFDNKTEYIDIKPESITWSFGDGTTTEAVTAAGMATQTHTYPYSGIYQCLITVNYPNGYREQKQVMAVLYSGNIIPQGISQNGQQKRRAGV